MKITVARSVFFGVLLLTASWTSAQRYQPTLEMRVNIVPEVTTLSGKPSVSYELYMTSFSADTLYLDRLNVFNGADSTLLFSVEEKNWNSKAGLIGNVSKDRNKLLPGQSMIVYLDFVLPKKNGSLYHELELAVRSRTGSQTHSLKGAAVAFTTTPVIVLGAPLKGGPWAAVYSADWERGHRRVIYTMYGKARIPGRYAIDFILLNDQGHFAKGNDDEIRNWFGYAAAVLAVTDGIVLSTRNDFPESATLRNHVEATADNAAGNYISIDIGNGKVVFYEHLQPGSVNVKPGQRVKKGEVIAALGFTGQTTGPHLHFHVADANATLGAEGLSFEFEKFNQLGTYLNFEEFGRSPWSAEKSATRFLIKNERPAPNSVIRF